MEVDDKDAAVPTMTSPSAPVTPSPDHEREKKRKRPEGQRCFERLMIDTLSVDLNTFPLSLNEMSEGYSYCLRSHMKVKKSQSPCQSNGTKQDKGTGIKRVSGLERAPLQELKLVSLKNQPGIKKKDLLKIAVRPKVMTNSPSTKTPKPATPVSCLSCSRSSGLREKSCRRGLDFGDGRVQSLKGDSADEKFDSTMQSMEGSQEIASNQSQTLLVYTRKGDRFNRCVRKSKMQDDLEKWTLFFRGAKQDKGKGTKTVYGLKRAPIQELKLASLKNEPGVKKKKRLKISKFRPKVMTNSPFAKTPKPATPIPDISCSQSIVPRERLCRRGLDLVGGKVQALEGDSPNEKFDSTMQSTKGSREIASNHSQTLPVYTRNGDCFSRWVRKKGLRSEGNDIEEDKWWEKERALLEQRAMSFITSVRIMQGNRPFMGWKASVVDSVIGVFLTQNAADSSSSSAFMSLAAKYPNKGGDQEKDKCTGHALDWNAVRCAEVDEVSHTIQERGMNNRIAKRIQFFLNNLYELSECLDLEWLREAKPEEAKKFLLSIFGLGLKSMECLRLLTLQQPAFPVDRHVGRIAVRLGWVPIKKLPDELLLHKLEEYPPSKSIQEYLSKRLCNLDVDTLYELHSQMITFGKVFCMKKKPNCKSCPLKGECSHYASASGSMLPVPGTPEEKTVGSTFVVSHKGTDLTGTESNYCLQSGRLGSESKPIPVIPPSPGRNNKDKLEEDMEDLCPCPEIPPLVAETEDLVAKMWNFMAGKNMPLLKDEVSKALVTVTSELAYIATHKPKNVGRLRTEHQVYVLPDSHPLVQGLDKAGGDIRDCYLLATWPQDEAKNFTSKVPRDKCSSSSNLQEENLVLGTLMIPCRRATRGSFPLDGTFFQINEVFADDETSETPIYVPKNLLCNLPRKTVYCGTSISSIFEGMSASEIRECFWEGFVCIRGFNMKTRVPKPLPQRCHHALSKTVKRVNGRNTNRKGRKDSGKK